MSVAEDCRAAAAGTSADTEECFRGLSPESTSTFDLYSFYHPLDTGEDAPSSETLFDFSSDVSALIASAVAAFPNPTTTVPGVSTGLPAPGVNMIPNETDALNSAEAVAPTQVDAACVFPAPDAYAYYSHYAFQQQSEDAVAAAAGLFEFYPTMAAPDGFVNDCAGMAATTAAYPYVAVPVGSTAAPLPVTALSSPPAALEAAPQAMMAPYGGGPQEAAAGAIALPYVVGTADAADSAGGYSYVSSAAGAAGRTLPPHAMDFYNNFYAVTCTTGPTATTAAEMTAMSPSAAARPMPTSTTSTPKKSRKRTLPRTATAPPRNRNKQTTDEKAVSSGRVVASSDIVVSGDVVVSSDKVMTSSTAVKTARRADDDDDDDDVVFERFVTPVDSFMHGPGIITGSTPAAEPPPATVERPSKRRAVVPAAPAPAKELPWAAAFLDVSATSASDDLNMFFNDPGWWV